MFRDESERVQQKYEVTTRNKPGADSRGSSCTPQSSVGDSISRSSSSLSISRTSPKPDYAALATLTGQEQAMTSPSDLCLVSFQPSQPLSDFATSFFLAQYIPGSHFDYLPSLYSQSSADSLLFSAIKAVAIASLSHETRNPEFMTLAREQYSTSLKDTKLTLASPDASLRDDVLAAILLLAHFEALSSADIVNGYDRPCTNTNATYSPSTTWARHVEGALVLFSTRPRHTSNSPLSARLNHHITDIIRALCVQQHSRMHPSVLLFDPTCNFPVEQHAARHRFSLLLAAYAELRACIREGSLTEPSEIVRWATAVDGQIMSMWKELDILAWKFDVVTTTRDIRGVYRNKYHVYPNHRIAQTWNTVRMTRISLYQIMHDYAAQDPQLEDQSEGYAEVIASTAVEICQSSSQFLVPQGELLSRAQSRPTIASAYFLIWPLFNSACSVDQSSPIRPFVIDRLEFIDKELKIPQARKAARMLERGDEDEDWMHMMHLF
ncbi:hypothetical protein LTR10_020496 [Elasticomyces elasticus]|uniref:Transcription factor domain-containing protein n=1 Tax=Exophiala sideris TaxID=1016849 RepID=A0ABR0J3R5_9EURO|nr:hypothetical protein LTR10_020496 [Elasticomyces elasticus]KAK5024704.1 hypothetical protein LTS07_008550 [Exophiala sideris]KAK5030798.1 hypothetical protein LTR13_008152 [Exophiala sideris]KAK5054339.1 hypothetical protein LTR69_008954 [Exophiala sideris]KAK5179740.1 hypothetical protein LTR44_007908 [Eurotiomycetes sp. CCFEE 6388]